MSNYDWPDVPISSPASMPRALSRREFLRASQSTAGAALLGLVSVPTPAASALRLARDWEEVRSLFDVPDELVFLQSGTATIPFRDALNTARDAYAASHDPRVVFVDLLHRVDELRSKLALSIGADAHCIAMMRNTTEAMRTVQFGLAFEAGDEVLAATVEYDLVVWRQSLERRGVQLKTFALPAPAPSTSEIVRLYEAHMTPRTRLLILSEVVSASGQVLPVRELCALARSRGIRTVVDGAQGYALTGNTVDDMGCDYYAASLHKWFGGPRGSGFLYVRSPLIQDLWPLLGNYYDVGQRGKQVLASDIRKFEQVGTIPTALWAAQVRTCDFLDALPPVLRRSRLQALRDRMMDSLETHPAVQFMHHRGDNTMGMACFSVAQQNARELVAQLRELGIVVKAVDEANITGIRVSPSIYNLESDIDRFTDALLARLPSRTVS